MDVDASTIMWVFMVSILKILIVRIIVHVAEQPGEARMLGDHAHMLTALTNNIPTGTLCPSSTALRPLPNTVLKLLSLRAATFPA